jgi:hypothetical protein
MLLHPVSARLLLGPPAGEGLLASSAAPHRHVTKGLAAPALPEHGQQVKSMSANGKGRGGSAGWQKSGKDRHFRLSAYGPERKRDLPYLSCLSKDMYARWHFWPVWICSLS